MLPLRSFLRRPQGKFAAVALGIVVVLSAAFFFLPKRARQSRNPELITPVLALQTLTAESLYYNAPARFWLLAARPELLKTEARDEHSQRSRDFAQAVQNPKLFRRLDRQDRFDKLLLVGDPSQYRPVLEHLLEADDWKVQYLDHTSIIFQRAAAARAWEPRDLEALRAHFPLPNERAQFLALAATRLIAIRRGQDAKPLLDEGQALDDRIPEIWSSLATYRMLRGEWTLAMTAVDRALRLDAHSLAAIATKTQILYSTKRFGEAFLLSRELIKEYPDDPALLFYHAKICHEAHAYTAEIETLNRLIARADAEGQPTAGYRTYLAQAYAADRQAEPAMREFRRVLADTDISPEQRRFAQETLTQIESRAGAK